MSFKVEDHYDSRKHLHVDHNMIFYEEPKSSCVECHSELYATLRPCFCTYLCKYTYKRVEKNLTSPYYKFGRGQYAFYSVKLSCFAEKKMMFVRNTRIS